MQSHGIVLCSLALLSGASLAADKVERPNILLIMSDDHAAAHVGCFGDSNVRTPHLDQLAAEGMRFERMYVACPQCVPSRASFMTGRSPVAIQMTRFSSALPADVVSFPEKLREQGYFTGICGRSFHLDGTSNVPEETAVVFEKYKLRTFAQRVDYLRTGNPQQALRQMTEFLGKVPEGKPFFLQIAFTDPHRTFTASLSPERTAQLKLPAHFPDTKQLRQDFAGYYGEIERLDGDVGKVLALLKERQLTEKTLVVFVGDNGCALLRGKGTLHEFGIRVPLIVRWPGQVAPGGVSKDLISGEDFAPTFLAVGGAKIPKEMTGRSFLPQLRGEKTTPREYVFAERGAHGFGLPTDSSAFDLARVIVGPRYKLIYTALPHLPYTPVDFADLPFWKEIQQQHAEGKLGAPFAQLYFPAQRPMFQLFDLEKDPGELTNLAGKKEVADVEKTLKAALQEWMIVERDFLPLPVPPPAPARR